MADVFAWCTGGFLILMAVFVLFLCAARAMGLWGVDDY